MKQKVCWLAALLLPALGLTAQASLYQTIKGKIVDTDANKPLAGASIQLQSRRLGVVSDSMGQFSISNVPVGRQTLIISLVGYEDRMISEIMVSSGKEVELTIPLTEKISKLDDVVVNGRRRGQKALNEFATVSSRSFTVEDTKRFPAAVFDPARMALNFPGVSSNGDGGNEIVIRGNSPKNMLWRMEGIEIPSPNHFASLGNSGGAISMLSSSTMGTSDFYTGAFPAEMGNATSGVFDLNLRTGNNDKREHAFMIGALGIEASTEGYFKKGAPASYLINYRYSTLALLQPLIQNIGTYLPVYQDLSFKVNVPTRKAGTFSLFGLGGTNQNKNELEADTTKWDDDHENFLGDQRGKTGIAGLSHQYFFNDRAYLKTTIAATYNSATINGDTLNVDEDYRADAIMRNNTKDVAYRANVMYNHKINSRNTFRAGAIVSHLRFNYNDLHYNEAEDVFKESLASSGSNNYYQAYGQWKYRVNNKWTLNGGVHSTYFDLNDSWSIEPRVSAQFRPGGNQTFTLASGVHTRPEHLSTYYFQPEPANGNILPNKDLDLPGAVHAVLGYEKGLRGGLQLKAEMYYQHLYNIGVEAVENSEFSMINLSSFWDLANTQRLVSTGKGKNYGIDIVVEKPFRNNYYFLVTGSVFKSTYTNYSGKEFSTRFNRGYQTNWVAGKEWKTGENNNRIIGLNAKLLASGGLRNSPIDLEASKLAGKRVPVINQYFTEGGPVYFRSDISFSYKINRKTTTHTLMLDIQNVTNRQNLLFEYYDNSKQQVKKAFQMGFLPVFNYRIEF